MKEIKVYPGEPSLSATSTDHHGKVYGCLTVLRYAGSRDKSGWWLCRCVCGKEFEVSSSRLNAGQKSCGCQRDTKAMREETRSKPTSKICVRCGRKFVIPPGGYVKQRICFECKEDDRRDKEIRQMERERRQAERNMEEDDDGFVYIPEDAERWETKELMSGRGIFQSGKVHTSERFRYSPLKGKALPEIEAMARERGYSYGQFVAICYEFGEIPEAADDTQGRIERMKRYKERNN